MRGTVSKSPAASSPLGPGIIVPISTLAPEPYALKRDIHAVVQFTGERFLASFFDANVHASGDTEEEAVRNLKSLLLDVLESLASEPRENLGPEPSRQLAVLREFIIPKC